MRDLTLVMPYYLNAGMLKEHQRVWSEYPDDLKEHLHVVVVDDGSPSNPAEEVVQPTGIASFRLYRTDVDIRWNWIFCKNLGASQAETVWILLTDIDHVLPADTLRVLLTKVLHPNIVYRFTRVDAPRMTPYKPHPNTWLMTKQMFDRVGGYDERLSGYYGTDADFRDRCTANSQAIVMLRNPMIRYPREVIPDASTTTYLRKQPEDRENVKRIRDERNAEPGWKPKQLLQPWRHVLTC